MDICALSSPLSISAFALRSLVMSLPSWVASFTSKIPSMPLPLSHLELQYRVPKVVEIERPGSTSPGLVRAPSQLLLPLPDHAHS